MRSPIDSNFLQIRPIAADDAEAARSFSCGDGDLDDFLRTDALRLQAQNVVRTFVAFYRGELVGYIALLVDAVELKPGERKKLSLHFRDHPIVPALKIARLAVSTSFRAIQRGMGEALVRFAYATGFDIAENVGCRLLTLDAYPRSIAFYERLGFVRNQAKAYEGKEHPSMRLDLFAPKVPSWLNDPSDPADPASTVDS